MTHDIQHRLRRLEREHRRLRLLSIVVLCGVTTALLAAAKPNQPPRKLIAKTIEVEGWLNIRESKSSSSHIEFTPGGNFLIMNSATGGAITFRGNWTHWEEKDPLKQKAVIADFTLSARSLPQTAKIKGGLTDWPDRYLGFLEETAIDAAGKLILKNRPGKWHWKIP